MGLAQTIFLRSVSRFRNCHLEIYQGGQVFSFGDPEHELHAQLFIHDERFYSRAVFGGDIGLGESFMDGDWSSPDLVALVRATVRNMEFLDAGNRVVSTVARWADRIRHRRNDNTQTGSRKNIAYHYDLGNEFYKLFLDESMAYSCGCFESDEDSLHTAQRNKFDRICRKLDLKASDHLLEIGTGWGGFAAYAAGKYGCRVTTTTISREQYEHSRAMFEGLPQGGRIELLFQDYRELRGRYDKLVSIEMFEAVGHRHYDEFFAACDRLLAPDGMMLLQTITMNERHFRTYLRESDWIKRYIFPGAELASVPSIVKSCARVGSLQLAHMEDIGEHYARTLRAWRMNFMPRLEEVGALGFDLRFQRMWEYYLSYCEGAFAEHYIGDAQLLLAKPAASLAVLNHWSERGAESLEDAELARRRSS
jgi:cyclopropane-fatty-acyl-phospholipid synthase